jgi:hypothetical protein
MHPWMRSGHPAVPEGDPNANTRSHGLKIAAGTLPVQSAGLGRLMYFDMVPSLGSSFSTISRRVSPMVADRGSADEYRR